MVHCKSLHILVVVSVTMWKCTTLATKVNKHSIQHLPQKSTSTQLATKVNKHSTCHKSQQALKLVLQTCLLHCMVKLKTYSWKVGVYTKSCCKHRPKLDAPQNSYRPHLVLPQGLSSVCNPSTTSGTKSSSRTTLLDVQTRLVLSLKVLLPQ